MGILKIEYENEEKQTVKCSVEQKNGNFKVNFPEECTKELFFEFMGVAGVYSKVLQVECALYGKYKLGIDENYIMEKAVKVSEKLAKQ